MVRYQFSLPIHDELIVDNFAGGGGASTAIELALGRAVDHALNHDIHALGMHRINHPSTIHHCENVFDVDPRTICEGRRVGFAWFSPDCRHFSKAKGGKPLSKRIRGLAYIMFRWAAIATRVMMMENVEEITTWGPLLQHPDHHPDCACGKPCGYPDPAHIGRTWQAFINILGRGIPADHPDIPEILNVLNVGTKEKPIPAHVVRITRAQLVQGFGYDVQYREIRASRKGAGTIRKRLFLIARRDGKPIIWPEDTHASPKEFAELREQAAREHRKPARRKPWRTVAEFIDWRLPCPSIFLTPDQARRAKCRRPLAASTLRRIAMGVGRYVIHAQQPFLVSLTHQGSDGSRIEPLNEPIKTITAAHRGEKALVDTTVSGPSTINSQLSTSPFITEHANASSQRNMPADEPGRTQCANVKGGHMALVAASLTKFTTGSDGQPITQPAPTICAGSHSPDTHGGAAGTLGLVAASLAVQTTRHSGGAASEPLKTVATGGHHSLVTAHLARDFGQSIGQPATDPAPTVMPGGQGKTSLIQTTVAPILAHTAHGEADKNGNKRRGRGARPVTEPLASATATKDLAVIAGTLVGAGGPAYGAKPKPLDGPLNTLTTENHTHLAAASMVKLRGDNIGSESNEPVHTISAGGTHHAVTAAYLAQHNAGFNNTPGHPATEPISSITAKGSQQNLVSAELAPSTINSQPSTAVTSAFLPAYYGSETDGQPVDESLRTATTKPRFGLATTDDVGPVPSPGVPPDHQLSTINPQQLEGARRVAAFLREHGVEFEGEFATVAGYVIVDIGMRMLTPRELFRCQGFPDTYVIDRALLIDPATGHMIEATLTKEQQIRMCGNSVSPPAAECLIAANVPELKAWGKDERRHFDTLQRLAREEQNTAVLNPV